MAGPVENTPSFLPGSSSASKCCLNANQARTAPMKEPISSPASYTLADERTDQFRRVVDQRLGEGDVTGDRQRQGDCRIQVGAALEGDVHAHEDGQAPAEVDEQPPPALALTPFEDRGGNDATAQEQQHC